MDSMRDMTAPADVIFTGWMTTCSPSRPLVSVVVRFIDSGVLSQAKLRLSQFRGFVAAREVWWLVVCHGIGLECEPWMVTVYEYEAAATA
jgi:hypothetical protein